MHHGVISILQHITPLRAGHAFDTLARHLPLPLAATTGFIHCGIESNRNGQLVWQCVDWAGEPERRYGEEPLGLALSV